MKENRITSGNPATAETSFRRGGNADLPRLRVLQSARPSGERNVIHPVFQVHDVRPLSLRLLINELWLINML